MGSGEVRLRYSGFVMFLSRLVSVGTGLLFVLMVTRSVTPQEFGIYGNISDLSSYFILPASIIPFWIVRFTARRHEGSQKTGFAANLFVSVPFALIYLLLIPYFLDAFQIASIYSVAYAAMVLLIIESYASTAFEATLHANRPQMVGFGFLAFAIGKVVIGFVLILHLRLGLLGVVLSVILANTVRLVVYLKLVQPEMTGRIRWAYVKEWLTASPVNLYSMLGQRLASLVLLLLFVYGGELARAYYLAASTIANIVGYSATLAFALYPRLLSSSSANGNGFEDVAVSLKMVTMFMVPMAVGGIILSDSYLAILGITYRAASMVLMVLVIDAVCMSLSSIFSTIVSGTEKLDIEAKIPFGDLVKSRLFLLFSLGYIKAAAAISLTYFSLVSLKADPLEAAVSLALISLAIDMGLVLVRYVIAKRSLDFNIPWGSLAKYIMASAVMAIVLGMFPHPTRILATLVSTAIGAAAYLSTLLVIDRESRDAAKSAIRETLKMAKLPSFFS